MTQPRRLLPSLFLLSLSVLVLEVCLTRIFSVLSWHHFAYLIISLALLGFGAAGSYLTVARRFGNARIDPPRLGLFAWLFAVSIVIELILVTKIRFYPVDIVLYRDYSNVLSLLVLYVAVGIPFFFAGVCIGRLVSLSGDRIHQFYFADLLGAGVGALAALGVINWLGAVAGVCLAASLAALVACLLGAGGVGWRRWAYGLTLVGAVGCTILTWHRTPCPSTTRRARTSSARSTGSRTRAGTWSAGSISRPRPRASGPSGGRWRGGTRRIRRRSWASSRTARHRRD